MGPSPSRILVIAALVVVGTLLPACDPTDLDPADDTDQFSASLGRSDRQEADTPLDLRNVGVRERNSDLVVTVTTYGDWDDVALGEGRSDLLVYLNTTEDGDFNRYLHIVYDDDLYCDLHHWEGRRLERLAATRPSARSVACVVDAASIPTPSSRFRWSAATNHTTQYSSQREWDWAPDVGYYEGEPL
ncbi:MAG: hypothetical protein JJE05_04970 [Actinobacteria bacterium]|nr:hypothetical protein [Actinomycetota bacterium]